MCVYRCPQKSEECTGFPGDGIWKSCEPPKVGAGNQTLVFSKSKGSLNCHNIPVVNSDYHLFLQSVFIISVAFSIIMI